MCVLLDVLCLLEVDALCLALIQTSSAVRLPFETRCLCQEKKANKKKTIAWAEFNRRFLSINSEMTLLIDIIDSNNAPLCIRGITLRSSQFINRASAQPIDYQKLLEVMKKFLIN